MASSFSHRSPLLRILQHSYHSTIAFPSVGQSGAKEFSEILELQNAGENQFRRAISRREFVKETASAFALGIGALSLPRLARGANATPKIAIVGAGLAGLSTAYYLRRAGLPATLYEAANRIGGRVITLHDTFGSGLHTELGGEFIDTHHDTMHELASHFDLALTSVKDPALVDHAYFSGGRHYSEKEVVECFRKIAPQIAKDRASLSTTNVLNEFESAKAFDNLSLAEYFDRLQLPTWFNRILSAAYTTEYGLDCGDQSSLNFIQVVKTDTGENRFDIFGDSDECCRIEGGNGRLTKTMAEDLHLQIETGMRLVRIAKKASTYHLTFEHSAAGTKMIEADIVVMTLPFSVLRKLEMKMELPASKHKAIQELGYGTNAKLITGFRSAPWRSGGFSGYTFTDEEYLTGWEAAHDPTTNASAFTMLLGGREGVNSNSGAPTELANRLLPGLDAAYTGSAASFTGIAERFHWPSNPYSLGCYSCYKPGQWTSIAGKEVETVGALYFAGEHCGGDFQGFMEGAALSGKNAALAIAKRIGK